MPRVLCCTCSEFFDTPPQCLECSNWNVCLPCLRAEGERTRAALRSRGIVLPGDEPVAFVQLDSGTVYAAHDTRFAPRPAPAPRPRGMTYEEASAAWEAHLRHRAGE